MMRQVCRALQASAAEDPQALAKAALSSRKPCKRPVSEQNRSESQSFDFR